MKLGALSLLLGVMTAQAATKQTPTTQSEPFLLLISEFHATDKPTAGPHSVGNCMIVYPGGRLHLELRRQEFFYGPASFVSYEGNLSTQELTSLRSILDSDAVKSLHAVQPPSTPLHADDFGWFTAEIWRSTKTQTVGTYSLHSTGPKNPEDNERAWQEAGIVLQPLIDWSHRVKSVQPPELARIPNVNSVCTQ
jgi:hypothetical protein